MMQYLGNQWYIRHQIYIAISWPLWPWMVLKKINKFGTISRDCYSTGCWNVLSKETNGKGKSWKRWMIALLHMCKKEYISQPVFAERGRVRVWLVSINHVFYTSLPWRHNELDGISNHRRPDCLYNRLFRRRSKKTPKLRVTGLCAGNSPVAETFRLTITSKDLCNDSGILNIFSISGIFIYPNFRT